MGKCPEVLRTWWAAWTLCPHKSFLVQIYVTSLQVALPFCAKVAQGVIHGVRAQLLQMCHNLPLGVLALPRALQGAGYTYRLQPFIHLALEDISAASSSLSAS